MIFHRSGATHKWHECRKNAEGSCQCLCDKWEHAEFHIAPIPTPTPARPFGPVGAERRRKRQHRMQGSDREFCSWHDVADMCPAYPKFGCLRPDESEWSHGNEYRDREEGL